MRATRGIAVRVGGATVGVAVGLAFVALGSLWFAYARAPRAPGPGAALPSAFAVSLRAAPRGRVAGSALDVSLPLDGALEVSIDARVTDATLTVVDDAGRALAAPFRFERVPPMAARATALVPLRALAPHVGATRGAIAAGARTERVTLAEATPMAAADAVTVDEAQAVLDAGDPARALAALDATRGALAGEAAARCDAVAAEAAFALGRNALTKALAERGLAIEGIAGALRARLVRALVAAQVVLVDAADPPSSRAELAPLASSDADRARDAALDVQIAFVHDRSWTPARLPSAARALADVLASAGDAALVATAALACRAGHALGGTEGGALLARARRAAERGSRADGVTCAIVAGDHARAAGHLDDAERAYAEALALLGDRPLARLQREARFSAALASARRGRSREAFERARDASAWVDFVLALESDPAAREGLLVDSGGYYAAAERFALRAGDARAGIAVSELGKGRAFAALLRDRGDGPDTGDAADALSARARAMRPDDAALSYVFLPPNDAGQRELAIGVVRPASTVVRVVALPPEGSRLLRALGEAVAANDATAARAPGKALYDVLLAPIEADLQGVARVFVSPHLGLHGVPWGALFDGERYAIERRAFARVPPLSIAARDDADDAPLFAPRAWLLALDPAHPGAAPLPGVQSLASGFEARATRREVLAGPDVTPERFLDAASRVDAVFYGGHAVYDAASPLASALLVAPSAAGDRVHARDVLGLDHRLALVFLLGCETSRLWTGKSSYGDEAMGLQRAFLAGGARHVLGALWPVLDRDAEDFVHALLARDASLDVVSAVGAAQRCLASGACASRGIASWASFLVDAR